MNYIQAFFKTMGAAYNHHGVDLYRLERWGYHLCGIIFAALAASLAYHELDFPLAYESLIVGSSAWSFSNKFHDYAVLFVLVAAYLVSLVGLSLVANRLARVISPEAEEGLHRLVVLFCTPSALWFAALLTTRNVSLDLLYISGALLAALLTIATVVSFKKDRYWGNDGGRFNRVLQKILLLLACTALSAAALGVSLQIGPAILGAGQVVQSGQVLTLCISFEALALFLLLAAFTLSKSALALERWLDRGIQVLQITFPLFFLLLVPRPWLVAEQMTVGYPLNTTAWLVIGFCLTLAAADLARRILLSRNKSDIAPAQLFSVVCVVGVLIFLKTLPVPLPIIPGDDYHYGEMLLPWWTWSELGMTPFWDFEPARGLLTNYFPGAIASTLFDGTAAAFEAVYPMLYAGILLVTLPVLSRVVGLGIAVLALFLMPYINFLSEIHIVVTAYLCVVCYGCLKWRPAHWTFVWLTLGAGLLLLAPGQGALAIVATGPLALFVFGRGLLTERFSMLKWALVFAGLALLLGLFTPLGRMLWGAVRYGLEQSSINSAAHGIAWSNSFAAAPVNPWVFEIIRASWLIVTLWAGALILKMRSPKWSEVRPGVLAFALPVFLLGVLFIIRAAGRIDPVATTRLGFASIWALCLLLPLLLFSNSRNRSNASLVFIWVALAGGIFPHFGGARNIFPFRFDPIPLPSATAGFVIGSDAGLPALGAARINPAQLKRLVSINKVLGSVLEPDEPYLDMSGRGAQYFYLQRRPPIEAGSIYNLVGEAQQLRAIASLKHHQPKAILIGADNLLQDGGPASLRSPLLYRFVVLQSNFKHVSIDGFDWLIAEERLDRLPGSSRRRVSAINDNLPSKIQTLFKTVDLKYIPASWGRSAPSLESRMELIQIVNNDAPAVLHSVRQIESGHFQVTGKDPFVRYDLSPWNLRGRDAGVLGFDFSCERTGPDPVIEIFWASGRNGESGNTMFHLSAVDGRLIVPLDTDPGWLLAEEIKSLRIDVQDKESCSSFRVDNVSLFQRAHVGAND